MEAMLGTILAVGFDFAPRGWALCNGQLLSIQNNMALYSLLGTNYGGDGKTTFGLPDLRGRTIVGASAAARTNVTPVGWGQKVGAQSAAVTTNTSAKVTIGVDHLPAVATGDAKITGLTATSVLQATSNSPGATTPVDGAMLSGTGTGPGRAAIYRVNSSATLPHTVRLSEASVKTTISGSPAFTGSQIGTASPQPLDVALQTTATMSCMQPSLGVNYIICLSGYYPPRQ